MRKIPVLGLNIGLHDSSAALLVFSQNQLVDCQISASERVSRKKHQGLYPYQSLRNLKRDFTGYWADLKNEHVGINSFGPSASEFEDEIRKTIPAHDELIAAYGLGSGSFLTNPDASFITHHLAHAYSTLLTQPFKQALIVVSDGMGNLSQAFRSDHPEHHLLPKDSSEKKYESFSVYAFEGGKLTPLKKKWTSISITPEKLKLSDGPGILFENASTLLFGNWQEAGKVMGLSAYGKASVPNGVSALNLRLSKLRPEKISENMPPRAFAECADLAATVQLEFEESMLGELRLLRKEWPHLTNLIFAGGCALNCLLNDRILREKLFEAVYIPPWPNDEGIAIGAALAVAHEKKLWSPDPVELRSASPFQGAETLTGDVPKFFEEFSVRKLPDAEAVVSLLERGEIIAWAKGRPEVGPRALGHRSILVRPDRPGIKDLLNKTIKFRESFRPYGVSVLAEKASEIFEVGPDYHSPFMTFAPRVREAHRELLKEVIQPDGSCRIQTLDESLDPEFHELLSSFYKKTGVPILIHTSLNVMGEPICESIEDLRRFFLGSKIRFLVIDDYLITKSTA